MTPVEAEILDLFDAKVARLLSSKLAEEATAHLGAIVDWNQARGWDSVFAGPEGEEVEAFVLTLRFLIQDNEPISLRNMRKLYDELPIPRGLAEEFRAQCQQLNDFLDSETGLSIEEGKRLTYRNILDLFVYGSLAHTSNARSRQAYREISRTDFFPLFQLHFVEALRAFLIACHFLQQVNGRARQHLQSN